MHIEASCFDILTENAWVGKHIYVHTTDKLVPIYVKVGGLASLAAIQSPTALAPPNSMDRMRSK